MLNMCPCFTRHDAANGASGYPVLPSEFLVSKLAMFSPNACNFSFGEFGIGMEFSLREELAAISVFKQIFEILKPGSFNDMPGIKTRAIVTGMARNWMWPMSVGEKKGVPVYQDCRAKLLTSEHPVSSRLGKWPIQAFIGMVICKLLDKPCVSSKIGGHLCSSEARVWAAAL